MVVILVCRRDKYQSCKVKISFFYLIIELGVLIIGSALLVNGNSAKGQNIDFES
jgi:hypothetical protein